MPPAIAIALALLFAFSIGVAVGEMLSERRRQRKILERRAEWLSRSDARWRRRVELSGKGVA